MWLCWSNLGLSSVGRKMTPSPPHREKHGETGFQRKGWLPPQWCMHDQDPASIELSQPLCLLSLTLPNLVCLCYPRWLDELVSLKLEMSKRLWSATAARGRSWLTTLLTNEERMSLGVVWSCFVGQLSVTGFKRLRRKDVYGSDVYGSSLILFRGTVVSNWV